MIEYAISLTPRELKEQCDSLARLCERQRELLDSQHGKLVKILSEKDDAIKALAIAMDVIESEKRKGVI